MHNRIILGMTCYLLKQNNVKYLYDNIEYDDDKSKTNILKSIKKEGLSGKSEKKLTPKKVKSKTK